ncbi:MAG: hypothetical protein AAFX80_12920 [Cyanobacteria bacterium J06639_18]
MDIFVGNLYFALKVTENGKQVMIKLSEFIAKITIKPEGNILVQIKSINSLFGVIT